MANATKHKMRSHRSYRKNVIQAENFYDQSFMRMKVKVETKVKQGLFDRLFGIFNGNKNKVPSGKRKERC